MTISINPKYDAAITSRAHVLSLLGHFDESIQSLNSQPHCNESSYLILMHKATICAKNNRFPEAIECLDECVSISKQDSVEYTKAILDKGYVLKKMDRYKEAITLFDKLINMPRIDKEILAEALNSQAECHGNLKNNGEALKTCQKIISLNLTEPTTYANGGVTLMQLKRFTHFNYSLILNQK